MSTTIKRISLSEAITLQRGFDLPERVRQPGAIPVVASTGIVGYHVEPRVLGPGVVIGRSGSIGGGQYIDTDFWPLNTTLWVKDFKGHEPRFVYFLLRSIDFSRFNAGAGVPTLNRNHLSSVLVPQFSPDQEQQIADILSSYDDLIENNRRRIQLSNKAAQLLYKEWFVQLRFPGHEHTRIHDGVPEGWQRRPLSALCKSIDYGHTASAQNEDVGPKFLRITDIVPPTIDWASVPHCEIPDGRKSKFLLVPGDIVIARTGATVGYAKRLHQRHPETVFASYLVRLRLNTDVDDILVGVFVESDQYKDFVKSQVGGAAQPNANARVLSAAPFLVPPVSLQRVFREQVEPMIEQSEVLAIQNQRLREARDLLLPRLINGTITI